jgi:hypothetical protein
MFRKAAMATKQVKLAIRISLFAVLAVLVAILAWRLLLPSTVRVENATSVEIADVELRFTVDGTPVPHKIGALAPGEKKTITLNLGSGSLPFAGSYRMGALKVKCDPGVSIRGRGEHVVLKISADKYEIVPE